jgi:hypothetical protein
MMEVMEQLLMVHHHNQEIIGLPVVAAVVVKQIIQLMMEVEVDQAVVALAELLLVMVNMHKPTLVVAVVVWAILVQNPVVKAVLVSFLSHIQPKYLKKL